MLLLFEKNLSRHLQFKVRRPQRHWTTRSTSCTRLFVLKGPPDINWVVFCISVQQRWGADDGVGDELASTPHLMLKGRRRPAFVVPVFRPIPFRRLWFRRDSECVVPSRCSTCRRSTKKNKIVTPGLVWFLLSLWHLCRSFWDWLLLERQSKITSEATRLSFLMPSVGTVCCETLVVRRTGRGRPVQQASGGGLPAPVRSGRPVRTLRQRAALAPLPARRRPRPAAAAQRRRRPRPLPSRRPLRRSMVPPLSLLLFFSIVLSIPAEYWISISIRRSVSFRNDERLDEGFHRTVETRLKLDETR